MHIEDRKTFQSCASYSTIGRAVKMSANTVRKYVLELEDKHLIRTESTTVVTMRDGRKRNGTLRCHIRPIREAVNYYHERQLCQLELAVERQKARRDCTAVAPMYLSAIRGAVQDSKNRVCRLLFKLAVEQDMVMNVLAAGMEIPHEQLKALRGRRVQNMKKTGGSVTLDDAVRYQNGGLLAEHKAQVFSEWMFPSRVKPEQPVNPGYVRKRLQVILERAGCKRVRVHDLRHPNVKPKTQIFYPFFRINTRPVECIDVYLPFAGHFAMYFDKAEFIYPFYQYP